MPKFSKEQFIDMVADMFFKKQSEEGSICDPPSTEILYFPDPPEPIYMREGLFRNYQIDRYGNKL